MPVNRHQILVGIAATGLVLMASSHRWTTGVLAQTGPFVFDHNLAVRTVVSGLTQPTSMAFLGTSDFLVVEKSTGQVIGRVGLWNPEGWPGIELGWIIRRSHWDHGFATEASRAALEWAWQNVETDHIISVIQPDNVRSIRVAEKIGERFERAAVMNDALVHIYRIDRPSHAAGSG